MKSGNLGIVLAVLGILGVGGVSVYNRGVNLEEEVLNSKATIQSSLQARLDKINMLMPTVQGYLDHESDTFKELAAIRSGVDGISTDSNGNMTIDSDATVEELANIDSITSSMVKGLTVSVEAYPELKADRVVSDFMVSIEGAENRIKVARDDYSSSVKSYNSYVRKFPTNIFAGILGFERMDMYEASKEAEKAPTVNFN